MLSIYMFLTAIYILVKKNTINDFYIYHSKNFCTFVRINNKFLVMKTTSIGYIIALFLCGLASHAASIFPKEISFPLPKTIQQYTYRVSGTVIDKRTHVIIPEAVISLKNLTTGQENTYTCDQYGTYTVVLDVRNSYLLQASAKGYISSEQATFKQNSTDPEQIPLKMHDFRLSKEK